MATLLRLLRLFLAGALFLITRGESFGAVAEQSISASRQFIVYGARLPVRGAICELAERTKRELLGLLEERDNWVTPIVINAQYSQANLPEAPRLAINVGQTGFGLKLQLDLLIDSEISAPEVRREILRALVLEIMYRGQSTLPAGTVWASPPDWLVDGVPGAQTDLQRDRVSSLLALSVTAGTVLPLEKLLQQRPELLDAAGRLLYRAYAVALVDLLANGPGGGPAKLARFIVDLPSASGEALDGLRAHFPGLFESPETAERTWQKQVARFSARQPYDLMSSVETEQSLAQKLRLKIPAGNGGKERTLAEFRELATQPAAKKALAMLAQDLTALSLRANPVLAPIVAEYAQISAMLARGKTGGIAKRLERLERSRRELALQMRGIDDYLNWFEATSLPGPSRAFAGYLKAAESAGRWDHTRRDPISVYLDAVETQFED